MTKRNILQENFCGRNNIVKPHPVPFLFFPKTSLLFEGSEHAQPGCVWKSGIPRSPSCNKYWLCSIIPSKMTIWGSTNGLFRTANTEVLIKFLMRLSGNVKDATETSWQTQQTIYGEDAVWNRALLGYTRQEWRPVYILLLILLLLLYVIICYYMLLYVIICYYSCYYYHYAFWYCYYYYYYHYYYYHY